MANRRPLNQRQESHRRRVVHGWAFRDLTPQEVQEIRAYLDGGPVPEEYKQIDLALGGLPQQ